MAIIRQMLETLNIPWYSLLGLSMEERMAKPVKNSKPCQEKSPKPRNSRVTQEEPVSITTYDPFVDSEDFTDMEETGSGY